jgi:predicted Zn-dependent protease
MTPSETNAKPIPGQPQGQPKSPTKTRREMLEEFAAGHPSDAFARYGLAMECAKLGDNAAAEANFKQLIGGRPEYVAAYLHYGQLLAKLDRAGEARKVFSDGIAQAANAGDEHARSELQAALDELA